MKKQEDISQPQQLSCFWLCAGLLAALAASNLSRDITRPFYGLHSWGQAHFAWVARSHVKYGLRYTKGFDTFAVGDPPTENPTRYLDHPQLPTLLDATAMLLFGINTWALRIAHMSATIATLLIFLKYCVDSSMTPRHFWRACSSACFHLPPILVRIMHGCTLWS